MSYIVCRIAKLKTSGQIAAMSSHHLRTRETLNADPSRARLNHTHAPSGAGDPAAAVQAALATVPKIRKNAVRAVEMIFSASPDHFAPRPGAKTAGGRRFDVERVNAFHERLYGFLAEKYGSDRIVSITRHMDEKTPHWHVVMVPLDTNKHGEPSLNARKFFGGRDKLRQLQTEVGRAFADLGLRRGRPRVSVGHEDVREFYAEISETKAAVEADRQAIADRAADLDSRERLLEHREHAVEVRAAQAAETAAQDVSRRLCTAVQGWAVGELVADIETGELRTQVSTDERHQWWVRLLQPVLDAARALLLRAEALAREAPEPERQAARTHMAQAFQPPDMH